MRFTNYANQQQIDPSFDKDKLEREAQNTLITIQKED